MAEIASSSTNGSDGPSVGAFTMQLRPHAPGWRLLTWSLRVAPVALALLHFSGLVDLDAYVRDSWAWAYRQPFMSWPMAEAIVAASSFFGWIIWFQFLDLLVLPRFRFVPRPREWSWADFYQRARNIGATHGRVLGSLPVYLLGIYVLHLVRTPSFLDPEAPSASRVLYELSFGIFAYDFIFYWIHLGMHLAPYLPHGHSVHHRMKVSKRGAAEEKSGHGKVLEYMQAEIVVNHSLIDGVFQVVTNIFVQNLCLFGASKHKLSRLLHNILITYLLTESHCGLDLPWGTHRLLPGILGGAYRHELHHHRRDCCFHQFFCYLDDLFGSGPPASAASAAPVGAAFTKSRYVGMSAAVSIASICVLAAALSPAFASANVI